jgi:Skp family chaperone for outer membrane proteins
MRETISSVAKQDGLSMVLEATVGVLFADKAIDMTDKVIRSHNAAKGK